MRTFVSAVLLISFLNQNAMAATQFIPVQTEPSKNFEVGNKYYDGTLSGLGEYMGELEANNPLLFSKLDAEYQSLKSRQLTGAMLGGFGILGGTVLLIGSMSFLGTKTTNFGYTSTEVNMGAAYGGCALGLALSQA